MRRLDDDQLDAALKRCAAWGQPGDAGTRTDLRDVDLRDAALAHKSLGGADLSGALLAGAVLYNCRLVDAELVGADLSGVNAEFVDVSRANLTGVVLEGAQLSGAKSEGGAVFNDARMRGAILKHAHLPGTKFVKADLTQADLTEATLDGANLRGATLDGAILAGASLQGADLRDVGDMPWYGTFFPLLRSLPFRFDGTVTRGMKSSAGLSEPWSLLCRTYSGPNYILNLIFFVAFVIPYAVQLIVLSTTGAAESALVRTSATAQRTLDVALGRLEKATGREVTAQARPPLNAMGNWLTGRGGRRWQIWQLLIGLNQGRFVPLIITAIIALNVLRFRITAAIAGLRDQELRSGITPEWHEYRLYFRLHQACCALGIASLVSLGWYLVSIRDMLAMELVLPG